MKKMKFVKKHHRKLNKMKNHHRKSSKKCEMETGKQLTNQTEFYFNTTKIKDDDDDDNLDFLQMNATYS